MKLTLSRFVLPFYTVCLGYAADPAWLTPLEGESFGTAIDLRASQWDPSPEGVLVQVETHKKIERVDFYVGDEKVGTTSRYARTGLLTSVFTGKLYFSAVGSKTLTAKCDDGFVTTIVAGPTIHIVQPAPPPVFSEVPPTQVTPVSMDLQAAFENYGTKIGNRMSFSSQFPNVRFEYGLTTAYGMTTSAASVWDTYARPLPAQARIAGLQPDTEYHYRLVVTTQAGTFRSADMIARTAVNQPPVTRPSIGVLRESGTCIVYCASSDDSVNDPSELRVVSATNGSHGTVEINQSGFPRIRYTAGPSFTDTDTFTYTIADPFGAESIGTGTVRSVRAHHAAIAGSYVTALSTNGYEDPFGSFSLQVTTSGAFTGSITEYGSARPFSGFFPKVESDDFENGGFESSFQDVPLPQEGYPRNKLGISISYNDDGFPEVSGGAYTAAVFNLIPAPQILPPPEAAAEVGDFVGILPNRNADFAANPESEPQGHGFVRMKVSRNGRLVANGRTGDNRAFSAGGRLRRDQKVFLNAVGGVGRRGRLTGLVEFNALEGATGIGLLQWSNRQARTGLYASAFNFEVPLNAERFTPVPRGTQVFPAAGAENPNVRVTVRDHAGDWLDERSLDLSVNNQIDSGKGANERLRININGRTGLFRGTLIRAGVRPIKLMGLIQPNLRKGAGIAGRTGDDAPIELVAE